MDYVLNNVELKQSYDSSTQCNGNMLACLIQQHFLHVSEADSEIPTFRLSWVMAIELRLKRIAESLADEYDFDMRTLLENNLPVVDGLHGETGNTLMNSHLQVFAKKRLKFQQAIASFHSPSLTENLSNFETNLMANFDKDIVEYSQGGRQDNVIGGRLYSFMQENIRSSELACTSLYNDKYSKIIQPKLQNALALRIPTNIDLELQQLDTEYFREAVGPAVSDMYFQLRDNSSKLEADLLLIPGQVLDLKIVGVSRDRVKLRWKRPEINPCAVEWYIIMIKSRGKKWEMVSTRKGYSALVTGLESSKWYCIAVFAGNSKYCGGKGLCIKFKTNMSQVAEGVLLTAATIANPVVYPCVAAYFGYKIIKNVNMKNDKTAIRVIGTLAIGLPILIGCGSIPVLGSGASLMQTLIGTRDVRKDLNIRDTEEFHWKGESSELDDIELPSDSEEVDADGKGEQLQDLEESGDEAEEVDANDEEIQQLCNNLEEGNENRC